MDIEQIKQIIELMKENDLAEFSMEKDGLSIHIKRGSGGVVTQTVAAAPVAVPAAAAAPPPVAAPPAENLVQIKAPMVGTFYRSASPDSPPFAEIGQAVDEESVVCIIEAMKVMNEIKAEVKGVIVDVLVDNGKPVEYGQPLFTVRVK
jgi:acetyl-CoA carboxylase biotin carboxyl carrier protein